MLPICLICSSVLPSRKSGAEVSGKVRDSALKGRNEQLKSKNVEDWKACVGALPEIYKQESNAGRRLIGLTPAQSHDNSVICLVILEETKTPDSIPGEIFGVLKGRLGFVGLYAI